MNEKKVTALMARSSEGLRLIYPNVICILLWRTHVSR